MTVKVKIAEMGLNAIVVSPITARSSGAMAGNKFEANICNVL